jgi:hypothetical protein
MKSLWNETFELLRRHILLWVPCSVAAIFMLAITQMNTAGIHWLVKTLSTAHSVFGGEVQSVDMDQMIERAYMITIPFALLRQFAEISFFVAALVTTKGLVQMIYSQEDAELVVAIREVVPRFGETLFLTLKYMAIMGAAGGITMLLVSSPLTTYHFHQLASSKVSLYIFGLAVESCVGWFLLPSVIRLLRPPGNTVISLKARQMGTIFAVSASAVALGLQELVRKAESTLMIENRWEDEAIAVVNTLIMNAPNIALFIALALLAIHVPDQEPSLAALPETT